MSQVKDNKQQKGQVRHEWTTPNKGDNDEKEEKKNDDDVKINECDKNKTAIVLIGNTGVGKSSLIRLLSGDQKAVKVSAGADRGTSTITTVKSKYNSNIYYIDTVGLQDSDAQKTDAKLLKGTLQYIHHEGFRKIKIIFCVSGDTGTRKGLFVHPARFIGDLRVENDDDDNDDNKDNKDNTKSPGAIADDEQEGIADAATMNATDDAPDDDDKNDDEEGTNDEKMAGSVWESVLIIKKEGDNDDKYDGVYTAAKDNGATKDIENKDKHLFGFTCTDWNNFDKNGKWYKKVKEHERENYGYYTEDGAKKAIDDKLSAFPFFELKFEHQLCINCGAEGDPRYMLEPCHTKPEQAHCKPLKREHIGQQKLKHLGDVKQSTKTVGSTHAGYKQQSHSGKNNHLHHPGSIKHAMTTRFVAGVFTLSTSEWIWYKNQTWDYYDCCSKYKNETGCVQRWSCCLEDPSNDICSNANETWSCCNRNVIQNKQNSNGCQKISKNVQIWDCCNKPIQSNGCEKIWSCCNAKGEGCKIYYPCCNNEDVNSKGCKTKCANCPVAWGKGPGCVIPQEYSH